MEKLPCNEWICNKINALLFKTFFVHHCNIIACHVYSFNPLRNILGQIANCHWTIRLHNIYKIEYIRFPSNIGRILILVGDGGAI